MQVPEWEGTSGTREYPAAASHFEPKGKKSKRRHEQRHRKELEQLLSQTVQVPGSSGWLGLERHTGVKSGAAVTLESEQTLRGTQKRKRPKATATQEDKGTEHDKTCQIVQEHTSHAAADQAAGPLSTQDSSKLQTVSKRRPRRDKHQTEPAKAEIKTGNASHSPSKASQINFEDKSDLAAAAGNLEPQSSKSRTDSALEGTESLAGRPAAAGKGRKRQHGLLDKMRSKLQGSHFRWLNEQLYTHPGGEAFELMRSNPHMFQQYHEGFQAQVRHWPQQPLSAAVAWVRALPASAVVADFGCGTAQLAAQVPHHVHSLDLVAAAPGVIACDMAHTPLEDGSVDAAVFCLALMGTDYGASIAEATRVLKPKGHLWIAEVRSRFAGPDGQEDHESFREALQHAGFKILSKDASNKMFIVFQARKFSQNAKTSAISWPILKPCQYKKR